MRGLQLETVPYLANFVMSASRHYALTRAGTSNAALRRKFLLAYDSCGSVPERLGASKAHDEMMRPRPVGMGGLAGQGLIPAPIDQNRCAHWRSPMDMMRQG